MIYYLSPDHATADRLRRIYTEIDEVNFEGSITDITDEHRHMFRIFYLLTIIVLMAIDPVNHPIYCIFAIHLPCRQYLDRNLGDIV